MLKKKGESFTMTKEKKDYIMQEALENILMVCLKGKEAPI